MELAFLDLDGSSTPEPSALARLLVWPHPGFRLSLARLVGPKHGAVNRNQTGLDEWPSWTSDGGSGIRGSKPLPSLRSQLVPRAVHPCYDTELVEAAKRSWTSSRLVAPLATGDHQFPPLAGELMRASLPTQPPPERPR